MILIVLPLLEKMLQDGSEWAQVTILEVLTDLCGSFHSDVGFEFFQLPMTGTLESLEIMLKKSVSLLIPVAQSIAEGDHNLTSQPAHEVLGSEVQ